MNTKKLRKRGFYNSMRLGIFLLLSFFFISGNISNAQVTVANKLKDIKIGADSISLASSMGEPTSMQTVERWYYNKDQAVFENGKIIDIRLEGRNRKIKFRREDDEKEANVKSISFLRIGMTQDEALNLAGSPDVKVSGNDWYYTKRHRVELNDGKVEKIDLHIKASLETLDWIRLNFSDGSLLLMNITIAFVMFGVALGIKLSNFKKLLKNPKPVLVGFLSQFILLPTITFLLVLIIRPTPSVAMGMILVAACPGGNVSNFISSIAKGNVALSVSLTGIATIAAIFMTPFNFAFWGHLYSQTSELVIPFNIDAWEMMKTVLILLGIPIVLGLWFSQKFPDITQKIKKPIQWISIIIFIGYVVAALSSNFTYFLKYIHLILLIVFIHNALAFTVGYYFPTLFKLPQIDKRTISIETGIQNSGLGLVLIFNPNLFNGLGGMAFIAAWWGVWHIIAGLCLGTFWSKRKVKDN
jgi:BASS family bile acid:Na+ symporter